MTNGKAQYVMAVVVIASLIIGTYVGGYFGLCTLGTAGIADAPPPKIRFYGSPILKVLYAPAAYVESWVTGENVSTAVLWR